MFQLLVENCIITTIAYLSMFVLYSLFNKPTNRIQACDIVLIVFLVIITGIRYDVGADWQQYYRSYFGILTSPDYIDRVFSWYGLDSGFWIVMSYISRTPFGADPHAIFWTVSILTYPSMVLYFRKRTVAAPWAFLAYLFLGFFGSSINMLRHTLAAVSFLWAFEARIERRYIAFALLSVLAMVFHSSVLFAIVVSLIAFDRVPSTKLLASCVGIGLLALAFFSGLFRLLTGALPFLARFQTTIDNMSGSLDRQYMWIVSLMYFSLLVIIVLLYLKTTGSEVERDTRMDAIVSAICMAAIPNIISFAIWPADRMAFFLLLFVISVIPYLIRKQPKLQVIALFAMCLWHVPYALLSWDNVNAFTTYLFM